MAPTATFTSEPVPAHPVSKPANANGTDANGFHQSLDNLEDNPLRRTWRGNVEGTIDLGSVPKFDNPYDEREWIKVRIRRLSYLEPPLTICFPPVGSYGRWLSLLGQGRLW